jgi:hypothetical protein
MHHPNHTSHHLSHFPRLAVACGHLGVCVELVFVVEVDMEMEVGGVGTGWLCYHVISIQIKELIKR